MFLYLQLDLVGLDAACCPSVSAGNTGLGDATGCKTQRELRLYVTIKLVETGQKNRGGSCNCRCSFTVTSPSSSDQQSVMLLLSGASSEFAAVVTSTPDTRHAQTQTQTLDCNRASGQVTYEAGATLYLNQVTRHLQSDEAEENIKYISNTTAEHRSLLS